MNNLICIVLLPFLSTSLVMAQQKIDVQGHRGSRGLMPENTIPAMTKALDLGVTTLEMDAVITSDKKVILSHEPFFSHQISTHPNGKPVTEKEEKKLNIYKMTFVETQRYDVGKKVHPSFPKQQKLSATKPLLSAAIDSAEAYAKENNRPLPFYNIETKSSVKGDGIYHPAPEEFVKLVMDVIKEKNIDERIIIQSFDVRTLQALNRNHPEIKTALLIGTAGEAEKHIKNLGFKPSIYSPEQTLVTPELIAYCHANDMKIIPWTVNSRQGIDKLIALGVDGIITDYPDLFEKSE